MLNYNAAGPYPSCFENLNLRQKKTEHNRILKRNFDHLVSLIPFLKPSTILPFAGSYILGGKKSHKNKYLGTTTWEVCAEYLEKKIDKKHKVICLREGQIFDIVKQKSISNYKKLDLFHMKKYIKKISKKKYDYEKQKKPKLKDLKKDILNARIKYLERIKRFNIKIKTNVYLKLKNEKIQIIEGSDKKRKITCEMDLRLLRNILDRKSHWNNAEIGAHISFYRQPNKMEPDLHSSLSFFHL